jgi:hypothetical protein
MLNKIFGRIKRIRYKILEIFNLKITNILYFPIIETKEELSYIVNSIASSIPYKNDLIINITVNKKLLNTNILNLDILEYQSDCITNKNLGHIHLVETSFFYLLKADMICLTEKSYLKKLIYFIYKIELIDTKEKDSTVANFYKTINWQLNNRKENEENLKKSKINYLRLIEEKSSATKSYVIAGGPSIKKYKEFDFDKNDFVISINDYVIKDFDFMDYVDVDAVCFADPVLFFGASKYTQKFYSNLIKAFNHKKFYIFVDIKAFDIFESMGVFDNYLIGVKANYLSQFSILNIFSMTISLSPSKNSFLAYGCSIAGAFSNTILALGADGMNENEMKKINKNYSDKRSDAYLNYNCDLPMLYRTYESSLQQHKVYNKNIKLFVEYLEIINKRIYTLTESNYEVLENKVWNNKC